jgi:hypothetical protein
LLLCHLLLAAAANFFLPVCCLHFNAMNTLVDDDLTNSTVPALREMARLHSISSTGTKKALVKRLRKWQHQQQQQDLCDELSESSATSNLDAALADQEKRVRLLRLQHEEQQLKLQLRQSEPIPSRPLRQQPPLPLEETTRAQPGEGANANTEDAMVDEDEEDEDRGAGGKSLQQIVRDALQQRGAPPVHPHPNTGSHELPPPSAAGVLVGQQYQLLGSRSAHLDICDFIVRTGTTCEEDTVLQTSDHQQQLILRSANKRVTLQSVTLREWNVANNKILSTLLQSDYSLHVEDYLSYTQMILELAADYEWQSVLQLDKQYRMLQHAHKFTWGTEAPRLYPKLKRIDRPSAVRMRQQPLNNATNQRYKRSTDNGAEICMQFNSAQGCQHPTCKYHHVCNMQGCSASHSRSAAHQHQVASKNL